MKTFDIQFTSHYYNIITILLIYKYKGGMHTEIRHHIPQERSMS